MSSHKGHVGPFCTRVPDPLHSHAATSGDAYLPCADGRRCVDVTLGKKPGGAVWVDMSVMDDSRGPAKVGNVTNEKPERLLTRHQVAQMFRVDPKTVTRWASSGRIGSIRTPGGHRRFRETEVLALLAEGTVAAASSPA